MIFSRTSSWSLDNRILLILAAVLRFATALDISYCSSQNTANNAGPFSWPYQSNGYCQTTCQFQYAYAILQGNNCWCSNYAPYDQTDDEQCNANCPGFQTDKCGNQALGLYGYYHLTISPSGTVGAPATSSTQTSTSTSASTTIPTPSTSTSVTTTWIPTPITVITTQQGSIQTVTVTPTVPSSAGETAVSSVQAPDPFWSSTAKVAGTFTVVAIVLVLLLVALGFFFWKRYRSSDSVAIRSVSDHDTQSTHGTFFGAMAERRHSKLGLSTAGGVPGRRGSHDRSPPLATPVSMSRRASQPLVHDQRLNPNALYAMGQDHGSRVSLESFQDDRDYSRPVLHVRNPDT